MIVFQMPQTMCYSGVVIVLNPISRSHKDVNNTGCLVTRNTYISRRKGLLWLQHSPVTKFSDIRHSKWQSSSSEGNYLALVCALSFPKAAFFNRGFSQVSSPSPLVCCLLLQFSDLAVDIPPQYTRKIRASTKAQTKWEQLHAVDNSPLVGFDILLLSVCLYVSQCMCVFVCVGGDPTLPLTICSFNSEKKK